MVLSSFVRFPILLVLATALLLIGSCKKTNADDPSLSPPSTNPAPNLAIQPFRPDLQDWPHNVSDVAPDPRVKYGRLENGLRYAVLPVEDKRGRISVQLNMDVGFNQEPEHLYGIAHLLEHIAFRGKRGDKDEELGG